MVLHVHIIITKNGHYMYYSSLRLVQCPCCDILYFIYFYRDINMYVDTYLKLFLTCEKSTMAVPVKLFTRYTDLLLPYWNSKCMLWSPISLSLSLLCVPVIFCYRWSVDHWFGRLYVWFLCSCCASQGLTTQPKSV